jgi:protoporphyrinogen oxidase
LHHDRTSRIRVAGSWVPYPYQRHLHHLPAAMARDALDGLVAAGTATTNNAQGELDFDRWMTVTFGEGIVRQFMRPYNEKVWAHPTTAMSADWIAERVAVVPSQQAVEEFAARQDQPTWGPNHRFAFPASGGTGEIYGRAAVPLAAQLRLRSAVRRIDAAARTLTTDAGTHRYDHLLWTGPLDVLVRSIDDVPTHVRAAADQLVHNSVTVVGIGVEEPVRDDLSWAYFPEPDVPFYRATNFGKYAPANVPGGRADRYGSWMTEIASSSWCPSVDGDDRLVERVIASLRECGLVSDDAPIVSRHVQHLPYAYPVPTLGRDAALAVVQPWLMERGIFARGRFGAWRYELGNMDHAVKMGVDVARLLVQGTPEQVWS